jgi:HAD superfamily hydrolase (TIGR01509 family)
MLKTVIFDFDGTLADTLPIVYKSFQHIFKTYRNEELTDEEVKAMFGPAEDDIIRKHFAEDQVETAIHTFHDYYWNHHNTWVKRSQEIENLLHFIKTSGLDLAIMTGKGRRSLNFSLKALEIADMFDMTVTGDEVTKPKPEPEGILEILHTLNTLPEEAIFVGDSDVDIKAGNSAGVETVGVQWLPTYQTPEFTTNPDHIFNQVEDFKTYLKTKLQ